MHKGIFQYVKQFQITRQEMIQNIVRII